MEVLVLHQRFEQVVELCPRQELQLKMLPENASL
jgi:hypothetical protein